MIVMLTICQHIILLLTRDNHNKHFPYNKGSVFLAERGIFLLQLCFRL